MKLTNNEIQAELIAMTEPKKEKISFEIIDRDLLWVARYTYGYRHIFNYKDVDKLIDTEEIKDIDILCTSQQPKHLQKFLNDYDNREDRNIYYLQDFYKIWEG